MSSPKGETESGASNHHAFSAKIKSSATHTSAAVTNTSTSSSTEDDIMNQLRECYEEMAKSPDPFTHAAALANRAEGTPGAVFDEINRILIARGGTDCRRPDFVSTFFRWRCQLCRPAASSSPAAGAAPPLEAYRHHYAMFDVTSASLPSTWVRGVLLFYKKHLKMCWQELEQETTAVVAAVAKGGGKTASPTGNGRSRKLNPLEDPDAVKHTTEETTRHRNEETGFEETITVKKTTVTTMFSTGEVGTTTSSGRRTTTVTPPTLPASTGNAKGSGGTYSSTAKPYYRHHPQGYLSANSVDLLREVIDWHFMEVAVGATTETTTTIVTTTTVIHPDTEVIGGEHDARENGATARGGGLQQWFIDTDRVQIGEEEDAQEMFSVSATEQDAPHVNPNRHTTTSATSTTRTTYTMAPHDLITREAFQRAIHLIPSLVAAFRLVTQCSKSMFIDLMPEASGGSPYPGSYRAPPHKYHGAEGGGEVQRLYTDILRSEFGSAEWLRYVLSMLLGALQLLHEHEYAGLPLLESLPTAARWATTRKRKNNSSTSPTSHRSARAARQAAYRHCAEALGRRSLDEKTGVLCSEPPTPVEIYASCQQLLVWTIGPETAQQFIQLLTLLFIQEQSRRYFPHAYYRRRVVELLRAPLLPLQDEGGSAEAPKEKNKGEKETTTTQNLPISVDQLMTTETAETTIHSDTSSSSHVRAPVGEDDDESRGSATAASPAGLVCQSAAFHSLSLLLSQHVPQYLTALAPLAAATQSTTYYTAVVLLQLFSVHYPSPESLTCPWWTSGEGATAAGGGDGTSRHRRPYSAVAAAAVPSSSGHSISQMNGSGGGHHGGGSAVSSYTSLPRRTTQSPGSGGRQASQRGTSSSPSRSRAGIAAAPPQGPLPPISSPAETAKQQRDHHGEGYNNNNNSNSNSNNDAEDVGSGVDDGEEGGWDRLPPIHVGLHTHETFLFHAYCSLLRPLLRVHFEMDRIPAYRPGDGATSWKQNELARPLGRPPVASDRSGGGGSSLNGTPHRLLQLATTAPMFTIPASTRLLRWRVLCLGDQPTSVHPIGTNAFQAAMGVVLQELMAELKDKVTSPPPPPSAAGLLAAGSSAAVTHTLAPLPSLEDQLLWLLVQVVYMDSALWAVRRDADLIHAMHPPHALPHAAPTSSDGGGSPSAALPFFYTLPHFSLAALKEGTNHLYGAFHHAISLLHPTATALLAVMLVNSTHQYLLREERGSGGRAALTPEILRHLPALPLVQHQNATAGQGGENISPRPKYEGVMVQQARSFNPMQTSRDSASIPSAVILQPPTPSTGREEDAVDRKVDKSPSPPASPVAGMAYPPTPPMQPRPKRHGRPPVGKLSAATEAIAERRRRAEEAEEGGEVGGRRRQFSSHRPRSRATSAGTRRRKKFLGLAVTNEEAWQSLMRLSRCADKELFFEQYKELLLARLLYYPDPVRPSILAGPLPHSRGDDEEEDEQGGASSAAVAPASSPPRRTDEEVDVLKMYWEGKALSLLREVAEGRDESFSHAQRVLNQFRPKYMTFQGATQLSATAAAVPSSPPSSSPVSIVFNRVDWRQCIHLLTSEDVEPQPPLPTTTTTAGATDGGKGAAQSTLLATQPLPVPSELLPATSQLKLEYEELSHYKKGLRFLYHTALASFTMHFNIPPLPPSHRKKKKKKNNRTPTNDSKHNGENGKNNNNNDEDDGDDGDLRCGSGVVHEAGPIPFDLTIHTTLLIHRILLAVAEYDAKGVSLAHLAQRVHLTLHPPQPSAAAGGRGDTTTTTTSSPASANSAPTDPRQLFDLLRPLIERDRILRLPMQSPSRRSSSNSSGGGSSSGGLAAALAAQHSQERRASTPALKTSSGRRQRPTQRSRSQLHVSTPGETLQNTNSRAHVPMASLAEQHVALNFKLFRQLATQAAAAGDHGDAVPVALEVNHWPRPKAHVTAEEHAVPPLLQAFRHEKVKVWTIECLKAGGKAGVPVPPEGATEKARVVSGVKHETLFQYVKSRAASAGFRGEGGGRVAAPPPSSSSSSDGSGVAPVTGMTGFVLTPPMFKIALEELMQKDLVKRSSDQPTYYEYRPS